MGNVAASATGVPLMQIIFDFIQSYAGVCVVRTLFWITTFNVFNILPTDVYLSQTSPTETSRDPELYLIFARDIALPVSAYFAHVFLKLHLSPRAIVLSDIVQGL